MTTEADPTDLAIVEAASDPDLLASVRQEVEAADPTPLAQTEDMRTLYRVLRVRARLAAEADLVEQQAARMVRQLRNRIVGIDFQYGPLLADVALREIEARRGRVKSFQTPFGTVGFRSAASRLEVMDERAVMAAGFVREVPARFEVDRGKLAEHFKATGEVPPGCKVLPAHNNFYVR